MVLQQQDSVAIWGWGNSGEQASVTGSWDNLSATSRVANTAKWKVKLKTPAAGGPYSIRIKSGRDEIVLDDVMIGEIWLCSGQSNMEWSYFNGAKFIRDELPTAYNRNIRFFHIPKTTAAYPQEDVKAKWQVCDSNSIKSFSAVGYYFGKKLNQELRVPVGLINASWGGTPAEVWAPAEAVNTDPILKEAAGKLQSYPWWPSVPGFTYNGMIAPLTPFSIAGAIWYQGEGNTVNHSSYARLMSKMIDGWRTEWSRQFPFYYVQIAPYKYGNYNVGALIQEQQSRLMNHPKTGMVVVTDLVDSVTNIHPSNKRDVGSRLANWALADHYGAAGIVYKHPAFEKMEIEKDRLVITIAHAPTGLAASEKLVSGFVISGETEEWVPAQAKIEGNRIILWNKALKKPAQARYGFGNTVIGNVFSKEGLPLTPFRTDDWPVDQSTVKN